MLDVDAEKVTDFSLVFEEECGFQTGDDLFNLSSIWAKDKAVICIDYQDAVMAKEETWVDGTLLEILSKEAVTEMKKPAACCLFGAI